MEGKIEFSTAESGFKLVERSATALTNSPVIHTKWGVLKALYSKLTVEL